MTMPRNLVLVRHGQSEGNIAVKASQHGDHSYYTEEFRNRPSRLWRLTDLGRQQAKITGQWLQEQFPQGFGRYYMSDTIRTWETAGHLDLPNPDWLNEPDLIERHWGELDGLNEDERLVEYGRIITRKDLDPFMWSPPGGESLHSVRKRIRWNIFTLHRECSDMDVIIVAHGEVMWCFRSLLERMTLKQFTELDASTNPADKINNCQVWTFSRIDPVAGTEHQHTTWMHSACPPSPDRATNEWRRIVRPRFSNADILAEVAKTPQLFVA